MIIIGLLFSKEFKPLANNHNGKTNKILTFVALLDKLSRSWIPVHWIFSPRDNHLINIITFFSYGCVTLNSLVLWFTLIKCELFNHGAVLCTKRYAKYIQKRLRLPVKGSLRENEQETNPSEKKSCDQNSFVYLNSTSDHWNSTTLDSVHF